MAGIGIITNPYSKLNKRNPRRQELLGYVAGQNGRLEITNSLEDLNRVAREFRDQDISVLAINGGDGTISRTLTAIINAYGDKPLPKVVILRGGTVNVLATNLGVKGSPEHILFRLMEAHSTGQYKDRVRLYTLKIEGEYGFLFGNGSCFSFLEEFYRNKTNLFGSVTLLLKVIASRLFNRSLYDRLIYQDKMTLEFKGKPAYEHQSCAVFCSTVEKMPLGIKLFWQNAEKSRILQVISAITDPLKAWYTLPLSILLRPRESDSAKISQTGTDLVVTSEKSANYTLDGELFYPSSKQVHITLGPKIEFLIV
ncbi:MAG: diacylglycerol kinase family protein [Bdellovibrionota bacterium]